MFKRSLSRFNFVLVSFLISSITSCNKKEGDEDKVNTEIKIDFDSNSYTLKIGEEKKVVLTYSPKSSDLTFKWFVSSTNIASVDSNGLLKGVSAGSTEVCAYYDQNNNGSFDEKTDPFKKAEVIVTDVLKINSSKDVTFFSPNVSVESSGGNTVAGIKNPKDEYLNFDLKVHTTNYDGDIPFIELNDFAKMLKYLSFFAGKDETFINLINQAASRGVDVSNYTYDKFFCSTKVEDGVYRIDKIPYNQRMPEIFDYTNSFGPYIRGIPLVFDFNKNVIRCDDYSKFAAALDPTWNNGIPNDPCTPQGIVETTSESKYEVEPNETVFDLNKYNLHLYEIDNKQYMPLNLAFSFFGDYSTYFYTGNAIIPTVYNPTQQTYFLSTTNAFSFVIPSDEGESITLTFKQDASQKNVYYASSKVLITRGNVPQIVYHCARGTFNDTDKSFNVEYSFNSQTERPSQYQNTVPFNYSFDEGVYRIYLSGQILDPSGNTPDMTYTYINTKESNFCNDSFGNNMKMFAYNMFLFNLDYFYGLKNEMNVDSFDNYFKNKQTTIKTLEGVYKNGKDSVYNHFMNASNITEYGIVINHVINSVLGDGHTGMLSVSPRNSNYNTPTESIITSLNQSERMEELMSHYYDYSTKRDQANLSYFGMMDAQLVSAQSFIIEGKTAIIRFDSFDDMSSIFTNTYNTNYNYVEQAVNSVDLSSKKSISNAYSQVYQQTNSNFWSVLAALKIAEKKGNIENIVFDITVNGGGVTYTIPLLLGLITDNPCVYDGYSVDGSISKFCYKVDVNGDGAYDDNDHIYANKFKYFILQSEFSFSCGSFFPAACKSFNFATIIGSDRSGGGACAVGYGSDVFGTTYRISAPLTTMMVENEKFITNDRGVKADYVFDKTKWYNPSEVDNFVRNLN